MTRAMQLLDVDGTEEQFAAAFRTMTAAEWEVWGIEQDVPIAEVRGPDRARNWRPALPSQPDVRPRSP